MSPQQLVLLKHVAPRQETVDRAQQLQVIHPAPSFYLPFSIGYSHRGSLRYACVCAYVYSGDSSFLTRVWLPFTIAIYHSNSRCMYKFHGLAVAYA